MPSSTPDHHNTIDPPGQPSAQPDPGIDAQPSDTPHHDPQADPQPGAQAQVNPAAATAPPPSTSQPSAHKPTLRSRLGNMFRMGRGKRGAVEVRTDRGQGDPNQPAYPAPQQQAAQREATINQLRKGYGEVVDTMGAVRQHLDDQAQRSDRMLELLEGLPEVLRQMPEQNQRQTEVLKAIHTNLESQRETTGQLSHALGGLTKATERQENTSREIQEHLQQETQAREQLKGSMDSVASSNRASRDAMNAVARQSEDTSNRVGEMFERNQKQMLTFNIISWALALTALAVAAFVAFNVIGQASSSSSSNAGANQPAAVAPAPTDSNPAAGSSQTTDAAAAATESTSNADPSSAPESTGAASDPSANAASSSSSSETTGASDAAAEPQFTEQEMQAFTQDIRNFFDSIRGTPTAE